MYLFFLVYFTSLCYSGAQDTGINAFNIAKGAKEYWKRTDIAMDISGSDDYVPSSINEFLYSISDSTIKQIKHKDSDSELLSNFRSFDDETKQYLVKYTANKMESTLIVFINDSQTLKEKNEILQAFQNRIIDITPKYIDTSNERVYKVFSELLSETLMLAVNKVLTLKSQIPLNETTFGSIKDKNVSNEIINVNQNNSVYLETFINIFNNILNDSSFTNPICDKKAKDICARIKGISRIKCNDERDFLDPVLLDLLCNGVGDCFSGADEKNCTGQVGQKLVDSITLLSDIDQAVHNKCLIPNVGRQEVTYDHNALKRVLEQQWKFYNYHMAAEIVSKNKLEAQAYEIHLSERSNAMGTVLNSLFYVLEGTLCSTYAGEYENVNPFDTVKRQSAGIVSDNIIDDGFTMIPRSCRCRQQYCLKSNCEMTCKHICWQKYSLNHWACQSKAGGMSISLNLICDGRVDCLDSTDEKDCTTNINATQDQANKIFFSIRQVISEKSSLPSNEHFHMELKLLTRHVREIQKMIRQPTINVIKLKAQRNEYFHTLVNIYNVAFKHFVTKEKIDVIHSMLLSLNEMMVNALKQSHTGNTMDSLITCDSLTCQFKKYPCNDANNTYVRLKYVCDDSIDCPNGEDENYCGKDVCTADEVIGVNHELQKVSSALNWPEAGIVLYDWKAKVIAAFSKIVDKATYKNLQTVVINSLRQLADAFSVVETNKMATLEVIKEFKKASNIVKNVLKSCKNYYIES